MTLIARDLGSAVRGGPRRPLKPLAARAAVAVGTLMFIGGAARAATMDRPSEGYVYFHRAGADMARHDAAIDACIAEVKGTLEPYIFRVPSGPLTALALMPVREAQQRAADRTAFDANLENCMVARGWDVVRVDDAEGKQLASLPQPQLAATLAAWVGAPQPHGQIVRQYAPIDTQTFKGGVEETLGPPNLSVAAGVHDLKQLDTPPLDPRPAQWRQLKTDAKPGAGASLIVVSLTTSGAAEPGKWTFVRMDEPAAQTPPGLTYFTLAGPAKAGNGSAPQVKTFAVSVPPGRWRLEAVGRVSLCLGGPAFDVGAGEAVFAGAFDSAHPYAPAMTTAGVADAALAARLKPANWTNGEAFDCSALQPPIIDLLELPGAPFADGYAAGSHAPR
jgi:hypothetical protein